MANAQLDLKFIPTTHGGRYLCLQGYMFRCDKKKATWSYWVCKDKTCPARVSTVDDRITRIGAAHNYQNTTAIIRTTTATTALVPTIIWRDGITV